MIYISYSFEIERFDADDIHKGRPLIVIFDKKIPSPHLNIFSKLFVKFSNFDYYFSKDLPLLQSILQKDANFPCLLAMIIKKNGNQKFYHFHSTKNFNFKKITSKISQWIEPLLKKGNKKEELVELDQFEFKKVVNQPDKDVLVKVYADWCVHCQNLKQTYENVAKFYKNVQDLTIAKIDGDSHKIPVKIIGYPTFLFYPKGHKNKPIQTNSIDTEEDLINFVKKNSVAVKSQVKGMKWESFIEKDEL